MSDPASQPSNDTDEKLARGRAQLRAELAEYKVQRAEMDRKIRSTQDAILAIEQMQGARHGARSDLPDWNCLLEWEPGHGVTKQLTDTLALFDLHPTAAVYDESNQVVLAMKLTAGDALQIDRLTAGIQQIAPHMRPARFEIECEHTYRRDKIRLELAPDGKIVISQNDSTLQEFSDLRSALHHAQREFPWKPVTEI